MYEKYQTEVVVLRGYERGEADRVYALFTREFGLVWARASAVRRENSRQRYALQTGAYGRVSLVRGKKGWRVAGAVVENHLDPRNPGTNAFARIALLLERLIHGEEVNTYLFEVIRGAREALMRHNKEEGAMIELVAVARLLFALGYLSTEALGSALFVETAYAHDQIQEVQSKRSILLSSVNKALGETHL